MKVKKLPANASTALKIIKIVKNCGAEAYLIGGCVRDLYLGIEPKDYDVATSLPPDEILKLFPHSNETGKSFGVVRVNDQGEEVEVATFRLDGPYSDGRRPDYVTFSSLKEDISRRDFTINALALNSDTLEIIDYVGGIDDLENGIVRTVGLPEKRFQEDRLRLIRSIRFAHRLNFKIEDETGKALTRMAQEIKTVAMERVADEFQKILLTSPAGDGIKMLDRYGLLSPILPEIIRMKGVDQPEQFHPEGDVFIHTCLALNELKPNPTKAIVWATLFHDVGKPDTFMVTDRIRFHGHAERGAEMIFDIGKRLKLSNELIERVSKIILEHQRFGDIDKMRPGRIKNWVAQPHFEELLEVHRADCAGSHRDMSAYEKATEFLNEIRQLETMPPRIITGKTLIEIGLEPGPIFKELLTAAYEAQLEDSFTNKEEGIEFVKKFMNENRNC